MPVYRQLGSIPVKRHIKHSRDEKESFLGEGLYYEHLTTLLGFDQAYSVSYHLRPPTRVKEIRLHSTIDHTVEINAAPVGLNPQHIQSQRLERQGDPVLGRIALVQNEDVLVSRVKPKQQQGQLYKNVNATEIIFIAQGSGKLESIFGSQPYRQYDYIVIPQGTIYRLLADQIEAEEHYVIETSSLIQLPQRYLNPQGQLKLGAPFYERDFHGPETLICIDQDQPCSVLCKQDTQIHEMIMAHHPFDACGWDGFVYPYTVNALDFEPITGAVHQPPPIHQFFEASGFVVCTFVPRYLDHHPNAIKVPYAHSNVMMDELLFYVDGAFSSRKGIGSGSMTLHPRGLTHGPHPGTLAASANETKVNELAVMIDTHKPLRLCPAAMALTDAAYSKSWMEKT